MVDLWSVVNEALITLVVALIGVLTWYLREWLKQKLSAEELSMVAWAASMAVQAAEQYGGTSEEKKRQAVALAETWLKERGIMLDLNSLDGAIEAALFKEINKFEQLTNNVRFYPGAASHRVDASE